MKKWYDDEKNTTYNTRSSTRVSPAYPSQECNLDGRRSKEILVYKTPKFMVPSTLQLDV